MKNIEYISQALDKPVVLVGLMGAGKSSIGRALANKMELEFVDSDVVVEGQERRTIADIFVNSGEACFRNLERQAIIDLVSESKVTIMGTGGGAFMNKDTREVIKQGALSVFLDADVGVLVKRVGTGVGRPLFEGKEPVDVLNQLIEVRYPIYKQADICVKTKDEPLNETLNRVTQALYSHLSQG